uniref:Gag-pol polyprotein n=1 Tax=Solanum tuberosum TaxID=4113 RepID=M1C3Z8_SOLTU
CFGCGQSGHRLKDCPSRQGQRGNNGRAQSKTSATPVGHPTQQGNSSSTGGGHRQNGLYALQAHQDQEDSPDLVTGVRLMSISDGGVTVQNGAESSLVVEVKEKQDSDPILLELKSAIHNQRVEVFSQGGDGVLRYQGRLCVPDVVNAKINYNNKCINHVPNVNEEHNCRDHHQVLYSLIQENLEKLCYATELTIGNWFTQLDDICNYVDNSRCNSELRDLAKGDNMDLQNCVSRLELHNLKNVKIVISSKLCLKYHVNGALRSYSNFQISVNQCIRFGEVHYHIKEKKV